MTRDLALLSTLGDESGIKITAVNHQPLSAPGPALARPDDAPAGLHSGLGVWLRPGVHLIHVQYARNIESGISFTQGHVRVAVTAGHTYIVRPHATADFGEVSFTLIDHGRSFPLRCLPARLGELQPRDARGHRRPFTQEDLRRCRESSGLS